MKLNIYDRVLEQEESEDLDTLHTVSSVVREHMRILNTQRDSDRLYLEHNMQSMVLFVFSFFSRFLIILIDILNTLAHLQSQIEAIARATGTNLIHNGGPSTTANIASSSASGPPPVPPSPSLPHVPPAPPAPTI
jgi:hypothetical protein